MPNVQILPPSKVNLGTASLICRQSIWGLCFGLLLTGGATVAMVSWWIFGKPPFVFKWIATPFVGLFAWLVLLQLKRALSAGNWLLAIFQDGIAIKLQSYLNPSQTDIPMIAYISNKEITGMWKLSESVKFMNSDGAFTNTARTCLAIMIESDMMPMRQAIEQIQAEIKHRSFKFDQRQIQIFDDHTLYLNWKTQYDSLRPSIDKLLTGLRGRFTIGQPEVIKTDLSSTDTSTQQAKDAIKQLEMQGNHFDAIKVARKSLGLTISEARLLIEELKQEQGG